MSARRRHAWTNGAVLERTLPDGDTGDRERLLLPPGAIFGGFVPLILTFLAEHFGTGSAEPMIIGTWIGCVAWAAAAFYGPETKDKFLVPDLVVA